VREPLQIRLVECTSCQARCEQERVEDGALSGKRRMVTTGMAGGRHATLHTQLRLCIHGEGISNQRIRNERRAQKAFGGLHNACTHGHAGWRAWTTIAFCNQSSLTKLVKMCALLLHPVATQGSCCMSCLHNPAWVARMCTNVTMGHATTARHLLQAAAPQASL
jgi:hypothetical protein